MKKNSFCLVFIIFSVFCFSYEAENDFFKIENNRVISKFDDGNAVFSENELKGFYDGKDFSVKLQNNDNNLNKKRHILKTNDPIIDFLYNLSFEECEKNIRSDGTFCAGEKWPGAWTRDLSYSIDLSLSFLFPEVCEKSLNARIENSTILQDTGSGGSWPVSTDRIVWAISSLDYALFKNEKDYFEFIYKCIKNTIDYDFNVNYDSKMGLFKGESSFIDWREQSYPRWCTSEFIADSFALGTNVVYYKALKNLGELASILDYKEEKTFYLNKAQNLKEAIIKNFYLIDKKYFASLILRDINDYVYQGYETLGESLAVLYELVGQEDAFYVMNAVKPQNFGLSVFAPQLKNIPSYHNDAVWPFVQSYRMLALKKACDYKSLEDELSSMIFASSMFATFKENYVASSFSAETQTNSSRQLWSDAGFLSFIYKVLFGLDFSYQKIKISPLVFDNFKNGLILKNFHFGNVCLNIEIEGNGDKIKVFEINEKTVPSDFEISCDFSKKQTFDIKIIMEKSENYFNSYKIERDYIFDSSSVSPMIPVVDYSVEKNKTLISWKPKCENGFTVFYDGKVIKTSEREFKANPSKNMKILTIFANDENSDIPLFPAKIVRVESQKNTFFIEAENATFNSGNIFLEKNIENSSAKYSSDLIKTQSNNSQFVEKFGQNEGDYISFQVLIKDEGDYVVDFRYKNGHGPVNTGEKCSLCAIYSDDILISRKAFPQLGSWANWSFCSPVVLHLEKGCHTISLKKDEYCYTQHHALNYINLDLMRISKIN